ncbi:MAG: hypothetical protein AB1714_02200 [Acidobacteriota bacterium]
MREVVLQIPTLEAEQNVDIEVKINGRKRTLMYRVEIISWRDYSEEREDRVEVIRRVIREHDPDWQLVQIGIPSEKSIPIMFRRKRVDEAAAEEKAGVCCT